MTIQIYDKGEWRYIKLKSGAESTTKEALAFDFEEKDVQPMVEYLESLGFQVIIK